MPVLALSTAGSVGIAILGGLVLWTTQAALVADYGHGKGYPFFPLFLSAWFLGFPLVLLAVVIGAGPVNPPRG